VLSLDHAALVSCILQKVATSEGKVGALEHPLRLPARMLQEFMSFSRDRSAIKLGAGVLHSIQDFLGDKVIIEDRRVVDDRGLHVKSSIIIKQRPYVRTGRAPGGDDVPTS
jgi:hypothetical protein